MGVASLVLLRGRASKLINIVATNEDDDNLGMALDKVANQIIHESKELSKCHKNAKNSYHSRVNIDTALDAVSATALSLLGKLSSKLNHTIPAVLIGNIITSVLINQATMLQITLANVLNRECLLNRCMLSLLHAHIVKLAVLKLQLQVQLLKILKLKEL